MYIFVYDMAVIHCPRCKAASDQLSWRGIYECILCEPGDYCDGCDTFAQLGTWALGTSAQFVPGPA